MWGGGLKPITSNSFLSPALSCGTSELVPRFVVACFPRLRRSLTPARAPQTPYHVDKKPGSAGLTSNLFFIWGGFCVICWFFVYFFVAETKGLSLEQVDILYRGTTMRKSNAYRKKILADNMHDDTNEAYQQTVKPAGDIPHKEALDA